MCGGLGKFQEGLESHGTRSVQGWAVRQLTFERNDFPRT